MGLGPVLSGLPYVETPAQITGIFDIFLSLSEDYHVLDHTSVHWFIRNDFVKLKEKGILAQKFVKTACDLGTHLWRDLSQGVIQRLDRRM